MPFWAFYMLACLALILLGWRKDKWTAPALILCGFLGVRLTPFLPAAYHELGSATVWLLITSVALYYKHYLIGFLLGISTIVYLPLMVVGFRIEYMGLLPIVSDIFLVLAIGACGGDIIRKRAHRDRYNDRRLYMLEPNLQNVAQSKERASKNAGGQTS